MNKRTGVGSLVTVTESHSSEHTRAVCTCRTRRHLGPVPTQVTGSWTFGSRVCGGLTGTSVWRKPQGTGGRPPPRDGSSQARA